MASEIAALRNGAGTSQVESDSVVMNPEICRKMAELLKNYSIPLDREDHPLPLLSHREIGNFYLLLVAICHQTSPLGKPPLEGDVEGRHLKGWDYLSAKLETAVRTNPNMLSAKFWMGISDKCLLEVFRDQALGDRLSDPAGRALLIRDLGQKMLKFSWSWADDLFQASQGRIASGDRSLLGLLGQFRAYSDPVYKKSFLFLALMRNSRLWSFADPDQLGAPIDYHEVRGHLRIGTVEIRDPSLRAKLMSGQEVTSEEDISIRRAVLRAVMFISECSGLRNPSQLHYMFWNLFRSCCARENPHCRVCPPTCPLPDRYIPLTNASNGLRHCPFSAICQSADLQLRFVEPTVQTDYY